MQKSTLNPSLKVRECRFLPGSWCYSFAQVHVGKKKNHINELSEKTKTKRKQGVKGTNKRN